MKDHSELRIPLGDDREVSLRFPIEMNKEERALAWKLMKILWKKIGARAPGGGES